MSEIRHMEHPFAGEPRTGVGTPDAHVKAGGAELGGDTGDVGNPRDMLGGTPGGSYGASSRPDASTVWSPGEPSTKTKKAREGR